MTFENLNNRYAGFPCILLGRGPSLDKWLENKPDTSGHIVIGINNVCSVTKTHYSISCDQDANQWSHHPTQWIRGIPYLNAWGKESSFLPDDSLPFAHFGNTVEGRAGRLRQTRDELAKSKQLYIATSSSHPAIHFAYYLGCSSLTLVGFDGTGGRAKVTDDGTSRTPPPDSHYADMRKISAMLCDKLFPESHTFYTP
jgi:hypothetical protein